MTEQSMETQALNENAPPDETPADVPAETTGAQGVAEAQGATEVSREADSRRRHVRLNMPLQASIDGELYPVVDWSLSGMQIEGLEAMPGVGARFLADVTVPFNDFNFALQLTCEIVWYDLERKRVGCRYIDLRDSQVSLLRYLVDSYVSGRIASVDGLLNTVNPTPGATARRRSGDDEPEPTAGQKFLKALKKGSITGLFILMGVLIVVFAGISIYNRLLAVSTELAWVHAPLIPVRATAEGAVSGTTHPPKAGVSEGTRLLQIENRNLRGELELAESTLRREEELLAGLRQQLAEVEKFFVEYNALAGVDNDRAKARVSEAKVALDISRKRLVRAKALFDKGHLPAANLEQQQAETAAAELNLELARADLAQSKNNAEVAGRGFFFTGTRVEGGEPAEIARRVRLAEEAVNIARTRVEALRAQHASLLIESPCDCVVHERLFIPGMWVEQGDLLYRLVEARDKPAIQALVSQDVVGRLKIGSLAEISLADRDEVLTGRIISIDRISSDSGALGDVNLVPNRHRFAEVSVALDARTGYVSAGLPAIVHFPVDLAEWIMEKLGFDQSEGDPAQRVE